MPAPVEFCGFQTSLLAESAVAVAERLSGIEIVCGALIWVDSGMPCVIAADEHERLEGRAGLEAVGVAVLRRDHVVEVGLALLLVAAHRARLGQAPGPRRCPAATIAEAADGLVGRVDVAGAPSASAARW